MPTSQFTIYTSADLYGPGPVNGITGSLLPILDACLVNGYGVSGSASYRPAAGWTQPLPNSASCGCYKQASGSQMTLFINDAGPSGYVGREAVATGWRLITNLNAATASQNAGAGYGQFPMPTQMQTYGFGTWRKSATADAVSRDWILIADDRTMYIWIADGTSVGLYFHNGFGDFYSVYGASDESRCFITGKVSLGNANIIGYLPDDIIAHPPYSTTVVNQLTNTSFPGCYIAGPPGGGSSINFAKKGDCSITADANTGNSIYYCNMTGVMGAPNPVDNNFYMSKIWLVATGTGPEIRGRMRGYYQMCHPLSSFADGQRISGSGDFAGKTFMIIKYGNHNGYWAIETSNTVETN